MVHRWLRKLHPELLIVYLVLLCFQILLPQTASAAESDQFQTNLELSYSIADDGTTVVEHKYKIINRTPTTFLNKYALKTSFNQLEEIVVSADGNELKPNIAKTDSGTSIGVTFPTEVVGEGKERSFTIRYTTREVAVIGGNALEVHIPKITDIETYDSISIAITTPKRFGEPVYTGSSIVETKQNGELNITSIGGVGDNAVSLLFGETQYYFLSLRYHLENTTASPGITQIALPPDTRYQKLHYHSLEPLPDRLERDGDGNWIATYTVPPTTNTTVHLTAAAKIQLKPDASVPATVPTNKHVSAQEFWEADDTFVAELAKTHNTPKNIYDHLVESFKYDQNFLSVTPKRKGAKAAFEQPTKAVCQEFTDAFIALSRANNIPARRLTGYAFTQNATLRPLSFAGDVLHAWPEYYDTTQEDWIPVDPTWGHTTGGVDYFNRFDLNHIVFAINGNSSTVPFPAGSYKTESFDSKDIEVSFAKEFPVQQPDIQISLEKNQIFGIPIPGLYVAVVHNQSGQAWYDMTLRLATTDTSVEQRNYPIPYLLPFQIRRIPVTLQSTEWLTFAAGQTGNIQIAATKTDQIFYERQFNQLTTSPKALAFFTNIPSAIIMGVSAVTLTLGAGSVLVLKRRKRRTLRR